MKARFVPHGVCIVVLIHSAERTPALGAFLCVCWKHLFLSVARHCYVISHQPMQRSATLCKAITFAPWQDRK